MQIFYVDLENPEKMRLLSLSEVSIQPRTSPPKFLKNRGVRMGVSGGIRNVSFFLEADMEQEISGACASRLIRLLAAPPR